MSSWYAKSTKTSMRAVIQRRMQQNTKQQVNSRTTSPLVLQKPVEMCVAGRNYGGWHVAGGVRSGPLLASRYRLQFKRKLPLLPRHQLVLSKLHLEKIMLATLLKHLHIYPPTATRTIPSIDRHTSPILPPQMRHLARHPALYQTGYSISRCKG